MSTIFEKKVTGQDSITEVGESVHRFNMSDGSDLFYRVWYGRRADTLAEGTVDSAKACTTTAPTPTMQRAVILLHRGHEHSARLRELAESLVDEDTGVFAWDARGHGHSSGERGDAEHFGVVVKDLDEFVAKICEQYGLAHSDLVLIGHSVGAVTLSTWVHDYAPQIRAMVLATPAFDVRLFVPLAKPTLRWWQKVRPNAVVKSYVRPWMLTRDEQQAALYRADELIAPEISVRMLTHMAETSQRVIEDAGAIQVPTLLLSAGADFVVNNRAHQQFFNKLGAKRKEHVTLEGARHGLFHDTERKKTFQRVREFVLASFDAQPNQSDLNVADREGVTYDEYVELGKPLPWYCWKRALFTAQRATLATIGLLSRGVQIGWKTGFDSGVSLDHVYENEPMGITPLGRTLDRVYLDSIGWKGIRQRRAHMRQQLSNAIFHAASKGEGTVRILDVAAGAGRYVLETVRDHPAADRVQIELRDFHQHNLDQAKQHAENWGVQNVTFRQHDAFATESYESSEAFDIVIVSGLYELFPSNEDVLRSLSGIRSVLRDGGTLIYTNQPWHPQLETIARVLPSHRGGDSWVMRRRTQAEMDQLVRRMGLEKCDMQIDRWGIFTVSSAHVTA